ncbi:helix-turn-helix domain-containing protein [Streptomyces sp. NPDC052225]|uniref:AraC-like ligand-binding domain-containing protein n=1 Tax=Streptomyces sp. NPDC052225 TaxID=3154949 RepID=UPI00343D9992
MWQQMTAADVPPEGRFEWFAQTVSQVLLPTAFDTADPDGFYAHGGQLALGEARLARFAYAPLRSRRTPALIRQGDPEQYQLALVTSGSAWFAQQDGEAELTVGDMAVWDTSHPYRSGSGTDGRGVGVLVLQIPKARMPLRSQHMNRLLARRIRGGAGMPGILAGFLTDLARKGPDCAPRELDMLHDTVLDLTASCLAGHLGSTTEQSPAQLRSQLLLRQVRTFIDRHLADPDLTPGLIAEHHHLSLRGLYDLFRDEPESVAATIRRRRLEHCRADLARPDLRRQPVQSIAARWGFTGAAAFSRTFRAAYGLSPRDYRAQALQYVKENLQGAGNEICMP